MAIKWISQAWRNHLETGFPQDHRLYIDFRQINYPNANGTPTFTLIASADNQPGSHNLTGGYATYLLNLPSTLVLDIYEKPTFAYDVATDQTLAGWYNDATHYLLVYYRAADDKYVCTWKDGGTERELASGAYLNNASLQVWTRLTFSLDLTTGTTAGSAFYIDGTSVDGAWSGNIDIKASYFPKLTVRHLNGTAGAYTINYMRLFQSKTSTAADVTNNFATFKEEETIWHFNGHSTGHTRCNVTSRLRSQSIDKSVESPRGVACPNSASFQLNSPSGEFADDQYAAFDPANEFYNGTSSQKYLQNRCPVESEIWYGGLYELQFVGRISVDVFQRSTSIDEVTVVDISASDEAEDMRMRFPRKTSHYENYDLCNPANETTNSILHCVLRLDSAKEVYNYLSNSSFENATIANSWGVSGAGASIARAAGGLLGSFEAQLTGAAVESSIYQTVTFTGDKKLDVGQTWTASIYIKSANACTGHLRLSGYDDAVEDQSSVTNWTITGGEGWKKIEASLTINDATIDRLRAAIILHDNVVISLDCAMLTRTNTAVNWFVLNDNDGAAGVESADDSDYSSYDIMGFDCDDADITHGWYIVPGDEKLWERIIEIGDATVASYIGIDSCGTFKYRTPFKTGYADPAPLFTVSGGADIASTINVESANRIVVHGIYIVKDSFNRNYWTASATDDFTMDDCGGEIKELIASGAYWPNTTTFPEYWAKYEEDVP